MGKKRKVLITGGTGSVGRELVQAFAAENYEVVFTYNANDEAARSLANKYGCRSVKIDLTKGRLHQVKSCDILVNNAAVNVSDDSCEDVSVEIWNQTIAINLTAPFLLCKQFLPGMKARSWGRVINVSSIYGLVSCAGNLPYSVSKHGLRALTTTVAKEYFEFGITSNELCPGAMESELMNRIAKREAKTEGGTAKQFLKSVASTYPGGRMVLPIAIARAAVFLASENAREINGVSIPIDHGLIA
jgi:3-hydroxybutyrate dehydrogenase